MHRIGSGLLKRRLYSLSLPLALIALGNLDETGEQYTAHFDNKEPAPGAPVRVTA